MYHQDLESWETLGKTERPLLAVGWLQETRPFPTGAVEQEFFAALIKLLRDPWQPAVALGIHRCDLCAFTGGPTAVEYNGVRAELGRNNLYVPAGEIAYVSPSLIAHYIDAHAYQPPDEFRNAVLQCPPMRSMEYLRAIAAVGVSRLARSNVDG